MLYLITAPAAEPITLTEAKAHLRVDISTDDTYIGALITAATQYVDGRDGILGRALVSQTWEQRLPGFSSEIGLELAPVTSITSVKYLDANGVLQTLAADVYELIASDWNPKIVLAYGKTWPTTRQHAEAVQIRFAAGYATVPAPIKQAVLLLIGHLYNNREAVNIGNIVNEVPLAVDALLAPYRVH